MNPSDRIDPHSCGRSASPTKPVAAELIPATACSSNGQAHIGKTGAEVFAKHLLGPMGYHNDEFIVADVENRRPFGTAPLHHFNSCTAALNKLIASVA